MKIVVSVILLSLMAALSHASDFAKATQQGEVNTRVMGCPAGSFWDPINGGQCWTCGDNKRAVHAVDGPRACIVAPATHFESARMSESNKSTCPAGTIFDVGTASCWVCPAGTRRTVFSVTSKRACEKIIPRKKGKAKFYEKTKSIVHSCKNGSFANVGSRNCYKCASGWKHDPSKKVNRKGVCYKPRKVERSDARKSQSISLACNSGFYDPIAGGSCWTCPSGYQRHVTPVNEAKACIKVTAPGFAKADFVKAHSPDTREIARGVSRLGCAAYGNRAFFDPRHGGSCWTCPSTHPVRSLHAVDSDKACMPKQCGQEGGRPCLVWERLPSCDKGLVEDFVHNQCRQPRNLSCKPFVQTVATLKQVLDKANAAGEELTEKVLDAFPVQKAVLQTLARKAQELQDEATKVTRMIPVDEVMQPMTEFLADNQDKVELLANMAGHAQQVKSELEDVLLDPDLVCSGDTRRLEAQLDRLGFASLARPSRRTVINLGNTPAVSGFPVAASAGPVLPQLAANDGLLKHHRIAFDLGLTLPLEKLGSFDYLKVPLTFGVQVSTNFNGETGVYFMHGLGLGASAKSDFLEPDMLSKFLGAASVNVGFQYNGPRPDTCESAAWAWGVPLKITEWVGIGIRPGCSAHWSGVTLTIPTPKRGVDIRTLANHTLAVSSPAGPGSVPSPVKPEFRVGWPEVKSFTGGGEGAWRIAGDGTGSIF